MIYVESIYSTYYSKVHKIYEVDKVSWFQLNIFTPLKILQGEIALMVATHLWCLCLCVSVSDTVSTALTI